VDDHFRILLRQAHETRTQARGRREAAGQVAFETVAWRGPGGVVKELASGGSARVA
jgi:hypothetical protein